MKKGWLITGIILIVVGAGALAGHLKGFAGASDDPTIFAGEIAVRIGIILFGIFCIVKAFLGTKKQSSEK